MARGFPLLLQQFLVSDLDALLAWRKSPESG